LKERDDAIELSVVVTIVEGGDTLAQCLDALAAQQQAPALEVLLPYDASVRGMEDLVRRFPQVRFLPLGTVATQAPLDSPAGQHELFDRRRAAGLAEASGGVVAILEDRGVPRADWARRMVEAHARSNSVIGGAVENGVDRLRNWAVYFCDFSRYQLPLPEGPAAYATDVNIAYKRAALERTEDLWRERYHETTVHWALQRAGEELFLTPSVVVEQHRRVTGLGRMLSERYHWGRLFAYTLAREGSAAKRLILTAKAPLLPFVLLLRHGLTQWRKRTRFGRFVLASPLVFALLLFWSLGEMVGYVTRRP